MAVIEESLHLLAAHGTSPIYAVEIGCMFSRREGLSTFAIAKQLAARPGSSLASIDLDQAHIDACRQLFDELGPQLQSYVTFYQGHSVQQLPTALDEMPTVDFAFIDGGGQPEVCLEELEAIIPKLSDRAIVLVDDAQEFGPTKHYPHPRPFGKATLILPMLITTEYRSHRIKEGTGYRPSSAVIDDLRASAIDELLHERSFCSFGTRGAHRVLAVAKPDALVAIKEALSAAPKEDPASTSSSAKSSGRKPLTANDVLIKARRAVQSPRRAARRGFQLLADWLA